MIIADTENHVIRKFLTRENKVVRIAGADSAEFRLKQPHGVTVDKNGALYIANHRVLKTTAE